MPPQRGPEPTAFGSRRSRSFVDQLVIRERLDHEQRQVDAARAIAREDGVAHVRAPDEKVLVSPQVLVDLSGETHYREAEHVNRG